MRLKLFISDVQVYHLDVSFEHSLRFPAVRHIHDAFPYHLAQQQYGAVSVARMFQASVHNWTLAFHHGFIFQRNYSFDLPIKSPVIRFSFARLGRIHILSMISALLGRLGVNREPHLLTVGVVNGHYPNRLLDGNRGPLAAASTRLARLSVDRR